ncbi:alanine racemase [Kitasatospora sp. NPDC057500]|uniref:alanine racemase n=1 Tax=Kitasatospora sp. NPDC057500 TaxID=3346151 RepID=UPI0036C80D31
MIDVEAIRTNLEIARKRAPTSKVVAVVKANAYGHGARLLASRISTADAYAVSCLEEAAEIRDVARGKPIMLLEGFFEQHELNLVDELDLWPVVHSFDQIRQLGSPAAPRIRNVWLKLDIGMNRLGFRPEEIPVALEALRSTATGTRVLGVMAQLSSADDVKSGTTPEQHRLAQSFSREGLELSLSNSAGVLAWPPAEREWIRPGIMIYGASPLPGRLGTDFGLKPAMTFTSELISVRQCRAGESVGYGAAFTCPQDMPVGTVAVGYGDGYPRAAPQGAPVLVNGKRAPRVGRVCMDMIMIDLRDLPAARPGDPVVLWGDGLPVEEIAGLSGTIPNELLSGIAPRVPRVPS